MSRRDDEPVFVFESDIRERAEAAWAALADAGVAAAVITDDPPWGKPAHRVQVHRRDATRAVEVLGDTESG